MPDEFPTLEAVALIGVLAALVGTWQLRTALGEIPRLAKELERALRAGDLEAARALTGRAEGAGFARVGGALVGALARAPLPDARELKRVADTEQRRAQKVAQRGRARDLVVAAVLVGAGAYATGAALGVGPFFYSLLAVALVVTALGPALRRALLHALENASSGVVDAAIAYRSARNHSGNQPCGECGASEAVRLGPAALGNLPSLGLHTLDVCRRCGHVTGHVESPGRIELDAAAGVELVSSTLPPDKSSADPEREHDG